MLFRLDREMRIESDRDGESRVLKFKQVLSLFLIASLLFPYSYAGAQGSVGLRVAVLELHHPQGDKLLTERMADQIRERLGRERGYQLFSKEETAAALSSVDEDQNGLASLLEKAKKSYLTFDFEHGARLLKTRLDELRSGVSRGEKPYLVPAFVWLGVLENASGRKDKALQAFVEAARLDPSLVLSEAEYAPSVRALFAKARGQGRGESPEWKILPEPTGGAKMAGFSATGSDLTDATFLKATLAAHRLRAERVVLVSTRPGDGGKTTLVAQLVDPSQPNAHRQEMIDVSASDRSQKKGVKYLANFLLDVGGVENSSSVATLQKVPQFKKPFWRRPAVWIIGGILLAGAGAGIALSGGGGDNTTVSLQTPVPGVTLR